MQTATVTERHVALELQSLEPEKWIEVPDFIGCLKQRKAATRKATL